MAACAWAICDTGVHLEISPSHVCGPLMVRDYATCVFWPVLYSLWTARVCPSKFPGRAGASASIVASISQARELRENYCCVSCFLIGSGHLGSANEKHM
jgi:hypothetical protein